MKPFFTFLFCFYSCITFSQSSNQISDPVDIPDRGWNKVVMIRNGNTVLFHFELRKQIVIKVFDKNRKEIASQNYSPVKLNVNDFDNAEFRGVYDINGEATLFIEQAVENKNALVRIRVDATSGKVLEEKVAVASSSFENRAIFRVLKQNNSDTYTVFVFKYQIHLHPENANELIEFNEKHEQLKSIPVIVNNKDYKYTGLLNANIDATGNICVSLYFSNIEITSTKESNAWVNSPTVYDKYLLVCYKPKMMDTIFMRMIKFTNDVYPSYTIYSFNPFARNLNLILLNSRPGYFKTGLQTNYIVDRFPLFISLGESDMEPHHKWVMYEKINACLKQSDTTKHFTGIPLKAFTNSNGVTTVVFEEYARYQTLENGMNYPYTRLGGIGITQLDDEGNEMWGTVLPKAELLADHLNPIELIHRDDYKALFRKSFIYPENASYSVSTVTKIPGYSVRRGQLVNSTKAIDCYIEQFASISCYNANNNFYFLFNDYARNFNNTLEKPGDTVTKYELTDAFYYKMDKKRTVTKNYLFGPSPENESRSVFLESADFDEKSNTYAALIFHRKGDNYTMHMAWCHLD